MRRSIGRWGAHGGKVVLLIVLVYMLLQYGVNFFTSIQSKNEKRKIIITTAYSGEGTVEVMKGDTLLLSGNGSVKVEADSDIKVQLSCTDNNLIDGYKVNGVDKEFTKGQHWEEDVQNLSEDVWIEADFKEYHAITIDNNVEKYEMEVSGVEYCINQEEENSKCYLYSSDVLTVKLTPLQYWLLKEIYIDGNVYLPEELHSLEHVENFYYISVSTNMKEMSFLLDRKKMPITVICGTGKLIINGVTVKNGQEIEQCPVYNCTYIIPRESMIVDSIYVNSNQVDLKPDTENWGTYFFKLAQTYDQITVHILERDCEIVPSIRKYFNLSKTSDIIYWPEKYSLAYIKQKEVTLECLDNYQVKQLLYDNNISYTNNTLSIASPSILSYILLETEKELLLCTTPLHFLYDGDAPTISDYSIKTYPTTQDKPAAIDITVIAKDTGAAGIDQVMCGTYEEYEKWVDKIESGTYESLHEKGNSQIQITFINQERHRDEEYYVWAIDCAANISKAEKLDMKGPMLESSTEKGWHNAEFQVTGEADEEVKGIFYSTSYSAFLQHTWNTQSEQEGTEQQSGKSKSKAWAFPISAKENKTQTYYVWAYDQYGNKSATPYVYEAKIDIDSPELKIARSLPEGQWSKDIITLSLYAKENNSLCNSGIDQVFYSMESDCSNPVPLTYKNDIGEYVLQSPLDSNGQPLELNQHYYFWAVDNAGNLSQVKETAIQIDVRAPILIEVSLTSKLKNDQVMISPYGICSKGAILLTVKAEDQGISSGLSSMHMFQDGKLIETAFGEQGIYKFELNNPFMGEISFQVEDGVGYTSDRKTISQLDQTLTSSYVRLENEAPQVKMDFPPADYTDDLDKSWYRQNLQLTVSAQDKGSGIKNIKTWINDRLLLRDIQGNEIPSTQSPYNSLQYNISTSQTQPLEDGSYHIKVEVTDYCGNVLEESRIVYIDKEAPKISQFTFTAQNTSYTQTEMVKKESYGYYFKGKTKVRIQATDNVASSGVEKIGYFTVDYGTDKNGVRSKVKVANTDANGGIDLILTGEFKGQLYAMAIDYVGNYTMEYSKPYGVIIESVEANSSTSGLEFSLPTTEFADTEGQPLYNDAIKLEFAAQDPFNGIRKVEWQVTSPKDSENNQTGFLEIDNKGNVSPSIDEDRITRDHNLVTSLKQSLMVANNSNNICVNVKITDCSGHCYTKKIVFSIDKTNPQVFVEILGGSRPGVKEYFNSGQLVKLKVKERNFDAKKVNAVIQNDLTGLCMISPWRELKDTTNPDNNSYTATVLCTGDGAYSLKGEVEDLAGNSVAMVEDEFVVDTINPKVDVTFSGTPKISNGYKFYSQGQTVTVKITEHNFDPIRNIVQCKRVHSLANPKELTCNLLSEFSTDGDSHTAIIEFKEEGWYTFSLDCKDKAGNGLDQVVHTEFGVDTIKPDIRIEGVNHRSANNGELLPIITVSDDNYASDKVKVSLKGSQVGEVVFAIEDGEIVFLNGDNALSNLIEEGKIKVKPLDKHQSASGFSSLGHQLQLDCFPKEESLDDLYTLTIEAEDKVGNKSSRFVEFSVNRQGSVYIFSSQLKKVAGTYVQSMEAVSFIETNVNSLVKEDTQVKLSRNGVVFDLIENTDYKVEKLSTDKQWSQYVYELNKSLFEEEGRYTITVHSKDSSGNINENDMASKGAEIIFGVDKTSPIIVTSNIKADEAYDETSMQVTVSANDNIALKELTIYLNGKKVSCSQEQDRTQFILPSSNEEQNIKIVAIDTAGNTTSKEFNHIYVTTNLWIQLCHNKVLLTVTGSVGLLILLGITYLLITRRNRLVVHKTNEINGN